MKNGYGSEWQLLRYLGRHRNLLNEKIASEVGKGSDIEWLDFNFKKDDFSKDKELEGFEFLKGDQYQNVLKEWTDFWPNSGKQPTWDAVGWLYMEKNNTVEKELLLVEAKAHIDEMQSNCGAKSEVSRRQIHKSFEKVQLTLGITQCNDWQHYYYQYANRISALWFLNQFFSTRLINIYFIGDKHKGKNCPRNQRQWEDALKEKDNYLRLDNSNSLKDRIHNIFITL